MAHMSGCMKTVLEPEIKCFFYVGDLLLHVLFIYLFFYVIYGVEPFSLVCAVTPREADRLAFYNCSL